MTTEMSAAPGHASAAEQAREREDDLRYVAERAAAAAAEVDREARFPAETLAALRERNLLNAVAPEDLGGPGLTLAELVSVAVRLGRACGASAMVWAMHQVQLACLVRHHPASPMLEPVLRGQWLIASVTSEPKSGGDLRQSHAGVQADAAGDRERTLVKRGSTVSYGAYAEAFLVTARAAPDADPGNQVAVLVSRPQVRLEKVGDWNTLGMRGTCSPAFDLAAAFDRDQVFPVPFREVAARTMVPLSHLLWAGVWVGLATEAVDRAVCCTRRRSRDATIVDDPALARAHIRLAGIRAQLDAAVQALEPVLRSGKEPTLSRSVELNALKVAASEGAVDVARMALGVCGMAGFTEDGPYSVARILRDACSAPLMIGNGRLLSANSRMLLLSGGER
ncbi:acyl-CoA dehydrogenase family protein [Actinoplanes subtropicus]|uniref:acyl-CoA dehydrogenase family protein n=1 Tax=Actinoplanes subtropicus TaxID=543632 RepID=UPI00068AAE4B|nr:acyl-CoA dehydrogenase family protein [Actinoplanes subtropicus]